MTLKVKSLASDKTTHHNIFKKVHYSIFIKLCLIQLFILKINFFFIKGYESYIFWNKFYLNNFNVSLLSFFYVMIIMLIILILNLIYNNVNYNIDYFFSIINIIVLLPFIIYVTNLYTFIFLLELISLIIFYKFITSRF